MTTQLLEVLEESRRIGFLGPGPVGPHLDHARAFAEMVTEPPARALDLGAGGGLPGLVLAALVWPATTWTFLDAQTRRTDFLLWAVEKLRLAGRVSVLTARAEEAGRDPDLRGQFDVVVCRSFGAPAVTAECAAPFLADDGLLIVSEPPSDLVDRRWPTDGLALLGLGAAELRDVETEQGVIHLVRIPNAAPVSDRYPRRVGIPAKRPLF